MSDDDKAPWAPGELGATMRGERIDWRARALKAEAELERARVRVENCEEDAMRAEATAQEVSVEVALLLGMLNEIAGAGCGCGTCDRARELMVDVRQRMGMT